MTQKNSLEIFAIVVGLALVLCAGSALASAISLPVESAGDSAHSPLQDARAGNIGLARHDSKDPEPKPSGMGWGAGVFGGSRTFRSEHFAVEMDGGVDVSQMLQRLSIPPGLKAILRGPPQQSGSEEFSEELELLHGIVAEILDIRLKKLTVNLKVCRDEEELGRLTENLFGRRIRTPGFYVAANNTLYINGETVTLHILGHELAHAILTHYFVVPPPAKVQEVLAGFVEYELRKHTGPLTASGQR